MRYYQQNKKSPLSLSFEFAFTSLLLVFHCSSINTHTNTILVGCTENESISKIKQFYKTIKKNYHKIFQK